MAISQKVESYLKAKKYKFSAVEHKTTFTAWDTAQTEKINPKEVAKTLVMKADNDYILAVGPGNRNLDKAKLLKLVNSQRKKSGFKTCKKIDLAPEAWTKKHILGKVGATPPFRGMLNLDIYADNLLLKNKKIYLGSGEYTLSLLVNVSQYIKNEKPARGSFSKKK